MVTRTKKIFVGGLSAPSTLEDVKSYFQQFGKVSQVSVDTGIAENPKCCFLEFTERAMFADHFHLFSGKCDQFDDIFVKILA